MVSRLVALVMFVVVAAFLVVIGWPQLFGLQRAAGIAQIVSLRGICFAVGIALVIAFTLVALISRGLRRLVSGIALLVFGFSILTLALLSTRGLGNASFQTKASSDLTVLSWNTLGDAPGASAIAQLAISTDADIVVLPETSAAAAKSVADKMNAAGHPVQRLELALDQVSKARTTSLLISTRLGTYVRDTSVGTTPALPSVVAVPADGTGPTIVAAHPVSPVPGEMSNWRAGLDWLAKRCVGPNVILAGDLNSTLDHHTGLGVDGGQLGRCHDAARATGNAAVGTWPTDLPAFLGAPIDHVYATSGWRIVDFRVIGSMDAAGSDHRPILAQLRPER